VDAAAALRAYAAADPKARPEREGYLSAFAFGRDLLGYLQDNGGSTRGYDGPCAAPFVWWDIDRPGDPGRALNDARRLAGQVLDRYRGLDDDGLLLFFSGDKGFHVGLPTALWAPSPSAGFNRVARRFADALATRAGVEIDTGVYDKVRLFRAPNSRHPRTGLHKRRLTVDELMRLPAEGIRRLAAAPEPFDPPAPTARCDRAAADWTEAEAAVAAADAARRERQPTPADWTARLNRLTMEFIRDGAAEGDRHRLLFSAAANLAEFGCPALLAHALLTEAALDSGLPPREVRRQIECGLAYGGGRNAGSNNDPS
jgi:hypothetical protein